MENFFAAVAAATLCTKKRGVRFTVFLTSLGNKEFTVLIHGLAQVTKPILKMQRFFMSIYQEVTHPNTKEKQQSLNDRTRMRKVEDE